MKIHEGNITSWTTVYSCGCYHLDSLAIWRDTLKITQCLPHAIPTLIDEVS